MKRHSFTNRTLHGAVLAAALAVVAPPGWSQVGDTPAERAESLANKARLERLERDAEERSRLDEVRRETEARVRNQEQALRGQQEAIRRLEEARARLEASSQEVAQLSSQLGRNYVYSFSSGAEAPRALLGISVETADGRRDGALVRQVSPGGAAAEAGIRPGDLIVSLAGDDLTKASNPGRALIEKMREVEPDTRVQVVVLRDGKRQNFEVTARQAPQRNYVFRSPGGRQLELQERFREFPDEQRENIRIISDLFGTGETNRFAGMEFATVSEGLGEYFGVKSGVLVVRTGADAPFGLEDGDVILSIDGRTPANAQHVGRILRSYQPGEKVKLRVQRDRKAIDVDTTAPGQRND